MISRVCSFVCLFVREAGCDLSKCKSPICMCHMSLLTFERSGSTFKVICFKNDPPTSAMTRRKNWPVNFRALARSTPEVPTQPTSGHHAGHCQFAAPSSCCVLEQLESGPRRSR